MSGSDERSNLANNKYWSLLMTSRQLEESCFGLKVVGKIKSYRFD
jgi:hypothetical protein